MLRLSYKVAVHGHKIGIAHIWKRNTENKTPKYHAREF